MFINGEMFPFYFSYRRMLKKDRLKKEKKSLDQLEKNDPESYAEKVKQLNKDRIEVNRVNLIRGDNLTHL